MSGSNWEHALSEGILRQAFIEYHERELAMLPSEEELEGMYTFSDRHRTRMKAMFSKADRKILFSTIARTARRTAATIAIIAAILFGVLLINPEVRAAVRNVIIEWYETFTQFDFVGAGSPGDRAEWHPTYVPEGFEESFYDYADGLTELEYTNSDGGIILFRCLPGEAALSAADNENTVYYVEHINKVEYHIFEAVSADYYSQVLWESDGYACYIASPLEVAEIIKIALSVERKK